MPPSSVRPTVPFSPSRTPIDDFDAAFDAMDRGCDPMKGCGYDQSTGPGAEQQEAAMSLIFDSLHVMRQQELSSYTLHPNAAHLLPLSADCEDDFDDHSSCAEEPRPQHTEASEASVDIECRAKMVHWCYQVVDFCGFSRETVEIAMNYVDRYVSTTNEWCSLQPAQVAARRSRRTFQLVAMTALYTAVKIHEPEAMDPTMVSNFSRGTYTTEEVEAMERSVVSMMSWHLNPPTTWSYFRSFVSLLPQQLLSGVRRDRITELFRAQAEFAVQDFRLVTLHASRLAIAALINALDVVVQDCMVVDMAGRMMASTIDCDCTDFHPDSLYVTSLRETLFEAIQTHPLVQEIIARPATNGLSLSPLSSTASLDSSSTTSHDGDDNASSLSPRSISRYDTFRTNGTSKGILQHDKRHHLDACAASWANLESQTLPFLNQFAGSSSMA
jgi:Cyclin, N-terminal domain